MRALGVILLITGLALLLIGANMDVTVATSGGSRVYNIGLMSARSNLLAVGGGAFLVGILLATFAGRKASAGTSSQKRTTRPCPYCAEPILCEAAKCKHCGSNVEPVVSAPLQFGWAVRVSHSTEGELQKSRDIAVEAGLPILATTGSKLTVGCFEARRDAKAALTFLAVKHGLHGELDFIRMR